MSRPWSDRPDAKPSPKPAVLPMSALLLLVALAGVATLTGNDWFALIGGPGTPDSAAVAGSDPTGSGHPGAAGSTFPTTPVPTTPVPALTRSRQVGPGREVLSFVSPDRTDTTPEVIARDAAVSTDLAVTGAVLGTGGQLVGIPGDGQVRIAHQHGARALLVLSNYDARLGAMNGPAAAAILGSAQASARVREGIRWAVVSGGWDGVVLDLESLPAESARPLTALISGVKADLGPRLVVVSVPAATKPDELAGYDLRRIGTIADRVDWMAYDQHTSSGTAGPVAGAPWVRAGIAFALTQVPREKLLLGVAGYGYLWPARGPADELTATAFAALQRTPGARTARDARQNEVCLRLPDGGVAWFSDAASAALWNRQAVSQRLAGIALWRVGAAQPSTLTGLPFPAVTSSSTHPVHLDAAPPNSSGGP